MRKQIFWAVLLLSCSVAGFARTTAQQEKTQLEFLSLLALDSIPYLSAGDSIFVESNEIGYKYFSRTLKEGQTLWSLCRYFGVKPNEIHVLNPNIDLESSLVGTKVNIPLPNRAIKRFFTPDMNASNYVPIFYLVKKGDTLYGIAQRNYKMPIDTLIARNNLAQNPLTPGQILHTGWMSIEGIPDSLQNRQALMSFDKDSPYVIQYEKERRRYNQRGPAVYLKSKGRSNTIGILHNRAKIGKEIEVYCPATKRTIFAKVLGKIPMGAHDPDIVAVLSKKAAQQLGVKSERFFVEIVY